MTESHTTAKVARLPRCDFCGKEAEYDFKTKMGPWANGCQEDWEQNRYFTGLGLGMGQKLILDTH